MKLWLVIPLVLLILQRADSQLLDCRLIPCLNGGMCIAELCECVPGFTGVMCETNIDECASSPCPNGLICTDLVNDFFCDCPPGFGGVMCEINIDECALSPCLNGGVCTDGVNAFSCDCVPGFTGVTCETNIDECASSPCPNGTICTDLVNDFFCDCPPGFGGVMCEINIDECASSPCLNGGVCTDGVNAFSCDCVPGFTGVMCEINIDECASFPCQNGGNCTDGVNAFSCDCASGFTGVMCEINIDECASFPCQNGGNCTDGVNVFSCDCASGFTGVMCEINIDECASFPCLNGGTCTDGVNASSFTCICAVGYTGAICDVAASDCDGDPCDENAECIELPGAGNFCCRCIPPFQGDGFSCTCPSGGGDDPHFSIMLPTGQLLCFTVQGEHNFAFNLISNEKVQMNAMFLPDSRRSEVTWMGSIGITAMNSGYKNLKSNTTSLRFVAKENMVYIGDKVVLLARNIEKLTFTNGKLNISEAPPVEGFKYPEVLVDLQDVSLSFSIKFMNEHLDIFWRSTGVQTVNSHGLIGQFFRKGIEIDEVRKILIMANKEPVPVMRRPVWSFMEREMKDDQLCWTAMNPGYQGEGLIDGTYFDYLVNDVLSTEFQFKKQQ